MGLFHIHFVSTLFLSNFPSVYYYIKLNYFFVLALGVLLLLFTIIYYFIFPPNFLSLGLLSFSQPLSPTSASIFSTPTTPQFGKRTSTTFDHRLACLDPETPSNRARTAWNFQTSRATPLRFRRRTGEPPFGRLFSSFTLPLDDLDNPDLGL